jgi:hypothetical protein
MLAGVGFTTAPILPAILQQKKGSGKAHTKQDGLNNEQVKTYPDTFYQINP